MIFRTVVQHAADKISTDLRARAVSLRQLSYLFHLVTVRTGASADKPGAGQEAQHDDNAGIHTNWHEQNPGAFHHLSKTHKENVRRRLSSIGPVIEEPKGISTRLLITLTFCHINISNSLLCNIS